jgi:hypothetical protein
MAKESHTIAQRLQELQDTPQTVDSSTRLTPPQERETLPPHLVQTQPFTGPTSETSQQHQGRLDPQILANGLAEPANPAQIIAATFT